MQTNQKQDRVTPFDWQRYSQQQDKSNAADRRQTSAALRGDRPMSASERAQRILATRWASPYSKAGVPSRSSF